MNAVVRHRGPDGAGVEVHGKVGLGHTRLSIIDLSERAAQPMERDGHSLSFNGEIYNYIELHRELKARGHRFTTTSDTEVLLAALIEWGMGALDRLSGMFAFAYLDEKAGKLFLARDRFGKKPLVYAQGHDFFCAASETKQILASGLRKPLVNGEVLLDFLVSGALNQSAATMIEGVSELRGGHFGCLTLATGHLHVERWYDLASRVARCQDSYAEARDKVRDLLQTSIKRRHRADVAIGACLSGGIDSSSIVAISAGLEKFDTLQTITSFAPQEGYDEREYSRSVAASTGVRTHELEPPAGDIWDPERLEDVNHHQDQPIPSGSHWNEYHVFKAAHSLGLRVMLDGQGADEYFGGYGEFWMAAQKEHLRSGRLGAFGQGIASRAEATGRSSKATLYSFARSMAPRRAAMPGSRIGPIAVNWLKGSRHKPAAQPTDFLSLAISELEKTSIPYQLHSEDRNSMRWSVESRLPFMDHELIEYVLGLPTRYKVGGGYQKRILRDAVPELPVKVATRRKKIGFAYPDATALKGREAIVREQIAAGLALLPNHLDRQGVLGAFDSMVAGGGWYDHLFFRLCSAAAWSRTLATCRAPLLRSEASAELQFH